MSAQAVLERRLRRESIKRSAVTGLLMYGPDLVGGTCQLPVYISSAERKPVSKLLRDSDYSGAFFAAPMGKPTVYADTLVRAATAVGGEARLATVLAVPVRDLRRWLSSEAYPSTEIYQKALDLLIGIGSH